MPTVEASSISGFSGFVGVQSPEQLWLFAGLGVDLAGLRMERAALAERGWSENTRRGYESDWKNFLGWCDAAGRSSLPCTSDTLQLYLVGLARLGRLPATIEHRAAAIAARHVAAGHRSPLDVDVREVLAGIKRRMGTAPRRAKAALSVAELRLMLAALPEGARGARDRAVLLLGFASGLRRSELVSLDLADVAVRPEGLALTLRRSKTDQNGRGRIIGVHRGQKAATCPVRAYEAWMVERGAWPGPLFCRIDLSGRVAHRRMRPDVVADVIQDAARAAGLEASRFGGHSLRAGCATAAAAGGASDLAILERTGHKSLGMLRRYVRHGSVFAVDPLRGVL